MPLSSVLRSPLRSPLRTAIGEGVGVSWLTDLYDADYEHGRFRANGVVYADEAALNTALGLTKSGLTRVSGSVFAAGATELVSNGDFAGGTTGWTGINGSTIAVVSGELQADGDGTSGSAGASAPVTCVAGRAYKLTGKVRRVTNTAGFQPFLLASSISALFGSEGQTGGINTTTLTEVTCLFGSVATTMYVGMQTTNSPSNISGMDDVSVKEVVPVTGWTGGSVTAIIEATTGPGHAAIEVLWQGDADAERNRVRLYRGTDEHIYLLVTRGNSAQTAPLDLGIVGDSTRFKVAFSASQDAFRGKLQGNAVVSDTVGNMSGIGVMRIGRSFTGDTWQGSIHRVSVDSEISSIDQLNVYCGIPAGLSEYGTPRGAWNSGLLTTSLAPVFTAEDLVTYNGSWYFCISGYTASGSSDTPDIDTTHWELLPDPLRSESTIATDDFETGAGAFATGRLTTEGVAWAVSGAGFASAAIGSGYASSAGNTYFVLKDLPRVPTRWSANEYENNASPLFTMSIGVDLETSVNWQLHTNFSPGGVGFTWYYSGQTAQSFATPKYSRSSATGIVQAVAKDIEVRVRGKFAFAYSAGALCGIMCDDLIPTLVGAADSVYTQNHDSVLGVDRVNSVSLKG